MGSRICPERLEGEGFRLHSREAPDEAGHMGDLGLKIEMIETFDQKIGGCDAQGLQSFERYRVLVLPDHPTPLSLRTHAADPCLM